MAILYLAYPLEPPAEGEDGADAAGGGDDYREILHPKRSNTVLRDLGLEKPYFQVFARKYGFLPDLSIMDLLFNEGPDSILYLKRCNRPTRFLEKRTNNVESALEKRTKILIFALEKRTSYADEKNR